MNTNRTTIQGHPLENKAPYTDKRRQIKAVFTAHVEFGNPKCDCRNLGICRVYLTAPVQQYAKKCKYNNTISKICVEENGHVEFFFTKEILNAEIAKKYFSKGLFVIEEQVCIPKGIQASIKEDIWIRRGSYPIIDTDSAYIVRFHN